MVTSARFTAFSCKPGNQSAGSEGTAFRLATLFGNSIWTGDGKANFPLGRKCQLQPEEVGSEHVFVNPGFSKSNPDYFEEPDASVHLAFLSLSKRGDCRTSPLREFILSDISA